MRSGDESRSVGNRSLSRSKRRASRVNRDRRLQRRTLHGIVTVAGREGVACCLFSWSRRGLDGVKFFSGTKSPTAFQARRGRPSRVFFPFSESDGRLRVLIPILGGKDVEEACAHERKSDEDG